MFSLFARKAQSPALAAAEREGRRLEREHHRDRQSLFRQEELARCIDRPLIIVPNEWDNPVVGFGKSIVPVGQSSVLLVRNYISGEDVICGGVRMDFSDQRLEIALSLDPYQLWAITAHNSVGHDDFIKPRSGDRWPRERILQSLRDNGFFERWASFREQSDA